MRTLFEGFGPKYTASTTVLAVANLKQCSPELCADFMGRCVLAVDKTYYVLPAAVRTGAGFPDVFTAYILSHFGAGLRQEIAKVVLSVAAPPDTLAARLAAAETVELELSKKMMPGVSALAVDEEQPVLPNEGSTTEKPGPSIMDRMTNLARQSIGSSLEELSEAGPMQGEEETEWT